MINGGGCRRQTAFHDLAGCGVTGSRKQALYDQTTPKENNMSILWIILIVVLVLALLGFFGRGRF